MSSENQIAVSRTGESFVRIPGIDLIRCIAIFSVLSVHFFLNNGFYSEPVDNQHMYCMVMMRTGFMVCVPLFIMLTGFLMNSQKLSRKYYRGIIYILEIYLIACAGCIIQKKLMFGEAIEIRATLLSLLDFSADSYAWYVEMYIGLFLLIPFLNLIYHGLNSKKQKNILLITMVALTVLPSVFNIFDLSAPGHFFHPEDASGISRLVPEWWAGLYPVTYYFIGAYISEYRPRLSLPLNITLLASAICLFGAFNIFLNYGRPFKWGAYSDWGSIQNTIDSILVFTLCLNLRAERVPHLADVLMSKIATLSFGIYMMSNITDKWIYPELTEAVPVMEDRLVFYVLVVPMSFITAAFLAQLADWAVKLVRHAAFAIDSGRTLTRARQQL